MSRQPFFPLFLGDLLAATAKWKGEERALYVMLLAYQWFNGPLPKDADDLALMAQYSPDRFAQLWPRVRTKFIETNDGLINPRCEEHRARARQLSATRSQLGRKGAAARWHDDDHSQADATGKGEGKPEDNNDGKSDNKPMALSHPILSHPIPTQSEEESTRAREQASQSVSQMTERERHERFERCKAAFPQFAGKQDWINAERAASTLVANGESDWNQLEAACARYAAYCDATGDTGTQYVMRPGKFFTDVNRPWAQAWTPPEKRAAVSEDRGASAVREFLKQGQKP